MNSILEFIQVFNSPSNKILFTECACYWFANILHQRFPDSKIVYDPHQIHFATMIGDHIYDITGIIEDDEEYVEWDYYASIADDADMIRSNCINLERR